MPIARKAAASSPSEQALELQSDGRGWARNMVNRLCIDLHGRVSEPCTRDNVKESYLTPTDHPVTVRLTGAGSGRRHLRLVVRRRRRRRGNRRSIAPSRSICASATAAPPSPPSMSPADPTRRSTSPPRSGCATSSSPASATASPPAKAIRTGRSRWPTKASASAPIWERRARNITGRAAPATKAAAPAKRRILCRSGSARARSGSIPPAIARSTATRPAPRWRSPCNIRISR